MTQATADQRQFLTRRLNLPFWLALVIAIAVYIVAFYGLRFVVPQQEIAGTLAALSLGGGAYIQRAIEGRLRLPPGPVVPMSGYLRPWPLILVGGVAAIWVAQALVPWVQLRGGPITAVAGNINALLGLLPPAVAGAVGVIAGQRSDRAAFLVAMSAVLGGWLLASLTYGLVIEAAVGAAPGMPPGGPPGAQMPPDPLAFYFGADNVLRFVLSDQLPLLAAAAMAGLWYGTRTRLQAYLGGLLREVSPQDRAALTELAYDGARAAQASRASAQERVGETPPSDPTQEQ